MSALHHEWVGPVDAPRTAVVVHGILGSGRNWRSFCRRLSRELPGWRFALVDLRSHGESPDGNAPHDVASCAHDLAALTRSWATEVAIGHSFGGKVVLEWCRQRGELRQVWVVDTNPGPAVSRPDDLVPRVLAAVDAAPVPASERSVLRDHLRDAGLPDPIVAWLLTGARKRPDGWHWTWNLAVVRSLVEDFRRLDLRDWLATSRAARIDFVRAGRSDRWDTPTIDFLTDLRADSRVRLHTLSNADHWVHVSDPVGLLQRMHDHWLT